MCGHGIIALAKVVLDMGILPATEPETTLEIDTPAGRVTAVSTISGGRVESTRFRNVPSFTASLDATVAVPGLGEIRYDLAFGGAFYAVVDAGVAGLTLDEAGPLISVGRAVKAAISAAGPIEHPGAADLGFLYGVIFTGPGHDPASHSRNVCVFADGEVDRSPTGTGVSARLAIMFEKGEVTRDERVTIESMVGSKFTGRVVDTTSVGSHRAVIPEIEGKAHIVGRSEMWLDPDDILGRGFLVG
jgi:trans-L-3-hydroxyproline dehydratase